MPKKQHSLFELCVGGRKAKEETEVLCPICSTAMVQLSMSLRIQHVESCLTFQSLKEANSAAKAQKSERVQTFEKEVKLEERGSQLQVVDAEGAQVKDLGKETKTQVEILERETKTQANTPGRKRELSSVQKEKLRYVNKEPGAKKARHAKTESPSTELLPSSRKTEIPELKTMSFPVSPSKDYRVSVDAFSFKPSAQIHQYFLSHFHSDHYGGISKRWCRERTLTSKIIYCSEITGRLLGIRYNIGPEFVFSMRNEVRYKVHCYVNDGFEPEISTLESPGLYVTTIDANHCPGAVIFLFESISVAKTKTHYLHCGDFRVCEAILRHPLLERFSLGSDLSLQKVYLDTTYMSPKHNFPKQQQVCASIAELVEKVLQDERFSRQIFGKSTQSRITDLFRSTPKKKLLVLVGTYLIGKERLATAISRRANNAPIYISNTASRGDKEEIIRSYHDGYIDSVLSKEPAPSGSHDVTIHLVPMSIAGNIQDIANYFNHNRYHQHFERCIGIRPTGWSFRGEDPEKGNEEKGNEEKENEEKGNEEENGNEVVQDHHELAQEVRDLQKVPQYSYLDIASQNTPKRYGKVDSSLYRSFAVPYSEHSSFRELSFFTIFFQIKSVIPTVNTGNEWSIKRMNEIIRRWEIIREMVSKKNISLSLEDF